MYVSTDFKCPKCGGDIVATYDGPDEYIEIYFRCGNGCCDRNGRAYEYAYAPPGVRIFPEDIEIEAEIFCKRIIKDMEGEK